MCVSLALPVAVPISLKQHQDVYLWSDYQIEGPMTDEMPVAKVEASGGGRNVGDCP